MLKKDKQFCPVPSLFQPKNSKNLKWKQKLGSEIPVKVEIGGHIF